MTEEQERDPSKPLDNPKVEQFCREYIIDLDRARAYEAAGYSANGARQSAYRLLTDADVLNRIEFLKGESLERVRRRLNPAELEAKADRVLGEMVLMGQADIGECYEVDSRGFPKIDFKMLKETGLSKYLKSMKYKEMPPITVVEAGIELEREVFQVEIQLWDKTRAGENLMKHLGMLKDKVEVEGLDKLVDALRQGRTRAAAVNKPILNGEGNGDA